MWNVQRGSSWKRSSLGEQSSNTLNLCGETSQTVKERAVEHWTRAGDSVEFGNLAPETIWLGRKVLWLSDIHEVKQQSVSESSEKISFFIS